MVPRIQDGDVVAIRKQPSVENGEIAAVRIGDEATLKHVYYSPDKLIPVSYTHLDVYKRQVYNILLLHFYAFLLHLFIGFAAEIMQFLIQKSIFLYQEIILQL